MLKTLSLSPDDAPEEPASGHSERRMLRALEALSHQPQPSEPPAQQAFRQKSATREPFRTDAAHPGSKARHRFVRDGEIPVVHVAPARTRDANATGAVRPDPEQARLHTLIEQERARAEQAERGRAEAQAQCKALQTKLAHTELALDDAKSLAEARLEALAALEEKLRGVTAPAHSPATTPPAPRRRGRPPKVIQPSEPGDEPEPVQWWLAPSKGKRRA